MLFGEGDYLAPDLLFVRKDRFDLLSDRGVEGPPDLVVEVISPATAGRDRGIKLDRYRLYRVPEYWLIDPDEHTVEVWKLAEGATESIVLEEKDTLVWSPADDGPSLGISVGELFGD